MDPITIYRLAKIQQEEIQAEFERYHRYRLNNPGEPGWPPNYRPLLGWGSLVLGAIMIVQNIIG
jgi:hypothetical protein